MYFKYLNIIILLNWFYQLGWSKLCFVCLNKAIKFMLSDLYLFLLFPRSTISTSDMGLLCASRISLKVVSLSEIGLFQIRMSSLDSVQLFFPQRYLFWMLCSFIMHRFPLNIHCIWCLSHLHFWASLSFLSFPFFGLETLLT